MDSFSIHSRLWAFTRICVSRSETAAVTSALSRASSRAPKGSSLSKILSRISMRRVILWPPALHGFSVMSQIKLGLGCANIASEQYL